MHSDYQLFGSGFLPLLAFDEGMIRDLSSASQGRHRASTTQLDRTSIARAWDANKRHLRAISEARVPANYGIRKEVTFRLDAVLAMWGNGAFDPDRSPHTGPLSRVVPLRSGGGSEGEDPQHHYPFWAVPTRVINTLIATQAARFVLPLDHIFREAASSPNASTTKHQSQPHSSSSSCSNASSSIQQILAFYTAQLLCRLLTFSLSSETDYTFDSWIWLSRWIAKVKSPKRGAKGAIGGDEGRVVRKERRGLGLRATLDAGGMLWIPHGHFNWQQGHLSVQILLNLYMPRSPLQAKLAHQPNLQAFTTSQVTVEYTLQTWLAEARRKFDQGRTREGNRLVKKAADLACEEVARAYHQHLLAKLALYWGRARDELGRQRLRNLDALQIAQHQCVTQAGRIVTAQTIWQIYVDAWDQYTEAVGQQDGALGNTAMTAAAATGIAGAEGSLPIELPCWMYTRRHKPPKNSWCDFVFDQLFNRPVPPTWKQNHFLQLYRTFKGLWEVVQDHAKPFDDYFGSQIGRYIMVTFNSDKTKEVGTSHGEGTWYHGKPSFFRIQFWAPYFSPPTCQQLTLGNAFPRKQYGQGLSPSMAAQTLSAQGVREIDLELQEQWINLVMFEDVAQSPREQKVMVAHCKRALWCMSRMAGPSWGNDRVISYMKPWDLGKLSRRSYGHPDYLRLPVPHTHVPADQQEDVVSIPTIILPTWGNIRLLAAAIGTVPYLPTPVRMRRKMLKQRSYNGNRQFGLVDYLLANRDAMATMPAGEGSSLLQEFLTQTEPPQWDVVESADVADGGEGEEEQEAADEDLEEEETGGEYDGVDKEEEETGGEYDGVDKEDEDEEGEGASISYLGSEYEEL